MCKATHPNQTENGSKLSGAFTKGDFDSLSNSFLLYEVGSCRFLEGIEVVIEGIAGVAGVAVCSMSARISLSSAAFSQISSDSIFSLGRLDQKGSSTTLIMKFIGLLILAATAAVTASISAFEDNYLDVFSFDQSILYLGDDTTTKDVKTLSKWSWNDCGGDDDALKLTKLDVSPDPPQSGRNLTIDAAGVVNRYISVGSDARVLIDSNKQCRKAHTQM